MRKSSKVIFLSLLASLLLIPIGFAAFSFKGEDVIFEYRDEDKDPTGLSYVTFDYNDANMTDSYKYYFDSSTTISESKLPLPNVDNAMHQFQGWYEDKQGTTKLNFSTHNFVAGEVFYAKYKNTSITSFTGAALNIYDGSPAASPMFFSKYNTMDAMNITGKIDVRYSSSGTYNSDTTGTNSATKYYYPYDAKTRIILDCDINVNNGGTLQLSSVLGVASGNNYNGIISNENYTAIDLNGYTITVKSGGNLNAYGIIYNSKKTGGIVVEDGGKMTTIFCMADFKGGTNLVGSYRKAIMSFGAYSCPYWFCETVFCTGATLYGETSLCASSSKYSTTAMLIGSSSSALIQLTQGYIIRKGMDFDYFLNRVVDYGNITNINSLLTSAFREKLIFTNDLNKLEELTITGATSNCVIYINSLSLTVSVGITVTASMAYGDFPIPPYFDIEAYSTNISICISMIVMPSAKIFIDSSSTLIFNNQTLNSYKVFARVTVLDEIPTDFYYSKSGTRTAGGYFLHTRLINSTVPGQVDMQGQFSFTTSGVDTSQTYKKYSIGGNVKLSTQALNSLRSQQDYVSLQSRFYYPNLYGYSAGSGLSKSGGALAMAARYYFSPIISENIVYFQLNGSNEIIVGETYDTYNGLFKYNDDIYFLYYTNRSNTVAAWSYSSTLALMSEQDPPAESDQNNKYENTVGNFVPVTSVGYAVDNTYGQHGMFITYNGNNYCYVNGAYIKASPTTGVNTVGKISGITDGEKFNVSSTQSSAVGNQPLCLSALTYDYKTERWLWNV